MTPSRALLLSGVRVLDLGHGPLEHEATCLMPMAGERGATEVCDLDGDALEGLRREGAI
jgi:hypothetical protein